MSNLKEIASRVVAFSDDTSLVAKVKELLAKAQDAITEAHKLAEEIADAKLRSKTLLEIREYEE